MKLAAWISRAGYSAILILPIMAGAESSGLVQFSRSSFAASEGQSNLAVQVVRIDGANGAVSVDYGILNGTALGGRDFGWSGGTLHFDHGQRTNSFTVPLIDTPEADSNRTALLVLHNPQKGVALGGQSKAVLAIFDNESPAVITVPDENWLAAAVQGGGIARFACSGIITLGQPIVAERTIELDAHGHEIILNAQKSSRHLLVPAGGELHARNITFANGLATNGGSIWSAGTLVLDGCTFSNNVAQGIPGADGLRGTNGLPDGEWSGTPAGDGEDGSAGQAGVGGAIFSLGELIARACRFIGNSAIGGRGGSGGDGGDAAAFVSPGHGGDGAGAGGAEGGGVFTSGQASFVSCEFITNSAHAGMPGEPGLPGTNVYEFYLPDRSAGASGAAADANGGAIRACGDVQILHCRFQGNAALGSEGQAGATVYSPAFSNINPGSHGAHGGDGGDGGNAFGGAVSSAGEIFATNNVWTGNAAAGGAGGHGGEGGNAYSTSGSTFLGGNGGHAGHGGTARGGAIDGAGALTLHGDVFTLNSALAGAGGGGGRGGHSTGLAFGNNPLAGEAGDGADAYGGAIAHDGTMTAIRVRGETNWILAGSGGAPGSPGTAASGIFVSAGVATAAGGSGLARGGAIAAKGTNRIIESGLTMNYAGGGEGAAGWGWTGAGRFRFEAPNGQPGRDGGAVFGAGAYLGGDSVVERCAVSGGLAVAGNGGAGGDGAPSLFRTSTGAHGGKGGGVWGSGIYFDGTAEVINSTIAGNQSHPGAGGNGGTGDAHNDGPIFNIDPTRPGGDAGSIHGSGITSASNSLVSLIYCTVASNLVFGATGGVGGVVFGLYSAPPGSNSIISGAAVYAGNPVALRGTIVAGDASTAQWHGPVVDGDFNLCSDFSITFDGANSLSGLDPLLGPLANHGGPTPSMALISGSPAIDVAADSQSPLTDQRGAPRPSGTHSDIGAFEFQSQTFTVAGRIFGGPHTTLRAGGFVTTSDADGYYSFTELFSATYQVTPESALTRFEPPSHVAQVGPDRTSLNFIAVNPHVELKPMGGSAMQTRVFGEPGQTYALESSTNLVTWQLELLAPSDTNGFLFWLGDIPTNQPQQFFRARRN